MHGFQQGMIEAGRNAGRVLECGGHYDAMTITWFVLGIVLWAAVMTTLVMGMIALVKHLKKSKKDTSDK
jgi:uncharacterized membrane protein